jgi:hypothetical protein
MVIAPFAHIGQNGQVNDQGQISSKQARAHLRSALHEGRWSGRRKRAQASKPKLNCQGS